MKRSVAGSIRNRVASLSETTRVLAAGIAAFVFCELGTRISAPHLNGQVLGDWIRRTEPAGLLALYDLLVGGALSRGAVLALGIMPYVSARLFMRMLRALSPRLRAMQRDAAGERQLTRATRWMTLGLSLVQSYGFARFALTVPGAVSDPGSGFIAQTMLTLTAGALVVMVLAEQFAPATTNEVTDPENPPELSSHSANDAFATPSASMLVTQPHVTETVGVGANPLHDQSAARTQR